MVRSLLYAGHTDIWHSTSFEHFPGFIEEHIPKVTQKALWSQVVSGVSHKLSGLYLVSNREMEQYSPQPLTWGTALVDKNIVLDPRHWIHQRVQAIGWLIHHWVNYLLREQSHSMSKRMWSRLKKVELPLTVLVCSSTGSVSKNWQDRLSKTAGFLLELGL